jgi:shikimate dehydrogenase
MGQAGYAGGNVTLPHKEKTLAHVARMTSAARVIGAINTLWFEEGELVGGNTDGYGFLAQSGCRCPGMGWFIA